ncbi:hypothetical protein LSH36_338g02006 [Paralvinella palmiformis]|uniref:Uncharacterized protein n=1 Tax=Paralvinella palmiformis TaxID=53620 RepID=A0AAD9N1N1_9ANNE|nr:hypothetical protein LSH36_338g02006 [Paralvinella palmiformis]
MVVFLLSQQQGTKFLCSVLVAPVKNENNEIILFILNLEDITDAPVRSDHCRNSLKNSKYNRHKSFRLRLPSLRRDAHSISKDEENPPTEESVPLHHITVPPDAIIGSSPQQLGKRPLDRELSNVSNWSNTSDFRSQKSSECSIRKATSLENIDMLSPELSSSRHKSATVSSASQLMAVVTAAASSSSLNLAIAQNNNNNGFTRRLPEDAVMTSDLSEASWWLACCPFDMATTNIIHNASSRHWNATANHLRQNFLSTAASDSELSKCRTKLSNSLRNIANDMLFSRSIEKESMLSSSKQGLFLPMHNMKHNVTEKVAQVSEL